MLTFASCVSLNNIPVTSHNGIIYPTNPEKTFAISRQERVDPFDVRSVFLLVSADLVKPRYSALILWQNGDCLYTYAYDEVPTRSMLETSGGSAGRYQILGDEIKIEVIGFDESGRRFVWEKGTYTDKKILLNGSRFDGEGWNKISKELDLAPHLQFRRAAFW